MLRSRLQRNCEVRESPRGSRRRRPSGVAVSAPTRRTGEPRLWTSRRGGAHRPHESPTRGAPPAWREHADFRAAPGEQHINEPWGRSVDKTSQKYLKFQLPRALRGVHQLLRGISEDGSGPARLAIRVDEGIALDAVMPRPLDGEVGVGLLDVEGFGIAIPCQGRGEPIVFVEQLVHPSGIEGLIILARGPRYSARGFPA